MAQPHTGTAEDRRAAPLLLLLLLALGGVLLHVPRERVPLVHDMLGYAGQALALIEGRGNTIGMGSTDLPGVYPAGVPLLLTVPMLIAGPDLRHGTLAILGCALLTLACVFGAVRRCAGLPAAVAAALLVLCSPLFRILSGHILSEVPTAMAVALVVLLWLSLGSRLALFAAGLVAVLSLLLRYANVSFPAALVAAELLLGGLRPRPRIRSLALLGAGMLTGVAVVAAHNAWAFGSPFSTGYSHWGWDAGGTWSLRNYWDAPGNPNAPQHRLLIDNFFGLARLQSVPMLLAAAWGAWAGWRTGGRARLLAGLCVLAIAAQYAFLAGFPFRYEAYLVPSVPLVAALGGLGAAAAAGARRRWLAPLAAAVLLAVSLAFAEGPNVTEEQAVQRRDSLEALGRFSEPDAVLLTTSDPALVEPLFRQPGRDVLYIGPYISPLVEEGALRELGSPGFQPRLVARYGEEMIRRGRPVYFDQNPPPRGAVPLHKDIRARLLEKFRLHATEAPYVFRLELLPEAAPLSSDPSGR